MKIQFDSFEVDKTRNVLSSNGKEKKLEPKVLDLLCVFLERPGETLSRDDLRSVVWHDVIVGDEVINRAVFTLRNVLGDHAKQPKFIETIPKKGYQFLVHPKSPVTESLASRRYPLSRGTLLNVSAVLSVILMVVLVMKLFELNISTPQIESIQPLTQIQGSEKAFAYHLSGKYAYIHDIGERSDIWIQHSGGERERITDDWETPVSPIWLDEKNLVYGRCVGQSCSIYRYNNTLGERRVYGESRRIYQITKFTENVVIFSEHQFKGKSDLKWLDINTGVVTFLHERFTDFPNQVFHPQVNINEGSLYYVSQDTSGYRLRKLDLNSGSTDTFTTVFNTIGDISMGRDGNVWIAGTLKGVNGIWQATHSNARLLIRATSTEDIIGVDYNDKTQALYYESYQSNLDLEFFDAESKQAVALPDLNSNVDEDDAFFSADGKFIYFISNRSGSKEIWQYGISTRISRQVTNTRASHMLRPTVSYDGEYLAVAYQTDSWNIAVFAIATGKKMEEFSVASQRFPIAWSRDNRSFFTTEYNKGFRIRRYDRDSLVEELVHEGAWMNLVVTSDGKHAIFPVSGKKYLARKHLEAGDLSWLKAKVPHLTAMSLGQFVMSDTAAFGVVTDGHQFKVEKYAYNGSTEEVMALPDWSWVSHIRSDGKAVLIEKHKMPQGAIMKIKFK